MTFLPWSYRAWLITGFAAALQEPSSELLLHHQCLFCSHARGMLQTEKSSLILKEKDTTLCERCCVTSPEKAMLSSPWIVNILHQWGRAQQLKCKTEDRRKASARASVSREQGEGYRISPKNPKVLMELGEFHHVSPIFCKSRNISLGQSGAKQSLRVGI